jgi:glycerophosphoryl diester phosphodiesterase
MAPENTVPAIQKALAVGADVIALDVQGTKDQQPLVFADTHLDRTTNRTGKLADLSGEEAGGLDAGSWFSAEYAGTRIPTLPEALAAIGDQARLMLCVHELRDGSLAEKVRQALGARSRPEQDVLLFWDSETLKGFRDKSPAFGYGLALGDKVEGWIHVEKAVKLGLKVVRPPRARVDARLVKSAHDRGLLLFAHFADEEQDMRDLLKLRVDGIVTGRPALLKQVLEQAQAPGQKA